MNVTVTTDAASTTQPVPITTRTSRTEHLAECEAGGCGWGIQSRNGRRAARRHAQTYGHTVTVISERTATFAPNDPLAEEQAKRDAILDEVAL